ncbi:MAG: Tim44-like domain-containing protein [Desulfobacterales bacterium]|nr:Tim44-like domain-containing protein [Desulfobacterales bacterium]
MKRKMFVAALFTFVLSVSLVYLLQEVAEARRMGGGGSFGSRPSYQRSAPAPSPSPTQPGLAQQPRQNPAAAPGAMGGRWGGMLGGLLMGGLIGSLLFGGTGMAGPGLLDILVIGGGLFLLMRFLRARRMAAETAPAGGGSAPFQTRSPLQTWGESGQVAEEPPFAAGTASPALPPGFDAEEFLKGAKLIYSRLQASWDKRDLEDIRSFTSPEVFAEIRQQAAEDPAPSRTEILLINARLLEVQQVEGREIASVHYEVMMREGPEDRLAKQVREIWHFSRDAAVSDSHWVLEGLQQVEG